MIEATVIILFVWCLSITWFLYYFESDVKRIWKIDEGLYKIHKEWLQELEDDIQKNNSIQKDKE